MCFLFFKSVAHSLDQSMLSCTIFQYSLFLIEQYFILNYSFYIFIYFYLYVNLFAPYCLSIYCSVKATCAKKSLKNCSLE